MTDLHARYLGCRISAAATSKSSMLTTLRRSRRCDSLLAFALASDELLSRFTSANGVTCPFLCLDMSACEPPTDDFSTAAEGYM